MFLFFSSFWAIIWMELGCDKRILFLKDFNPKKCMVYKHIRGMNALAWDKCTRPIVFKPAQIHQYITVTRNILRFHENLTFHEKYPIFSFPFFRPILLSDDLIKLDFCCQKWFTPARTVNDVDAFEVQ